MIKVVVRLWQGAVRKLRKLRLFLRQYQVLVLVVVFVVGIIAGFGFKMLAERTVIIGFEDYLIDTETQYMDLNAAAARVK